MKKLEVIPKILAEKLEAHANVIHTLIAAQRRGAAEQFGYAFLAGRALLQAKAIVPNGNSRSPGSGFKHWVRVNLPEITMRTAENWMLFAESILARSQVDAANSPLLLGSVELNGASHDSILQLVPEVMNGKGMMRFMRDTRLLRTPSRTQALQRKAIAAPETGKDKAAKARRLWEKIVADLHTGRKTLSDVENAKDLRRYLAIVTETVNTIRALLKSRKERTR